MKTMLEIRDVRKSFGKKEILRGISLSVEEGEIISVLGPSGCGKSTLLNIIAGILPLDGGSVSIRGKEVSGDRTMMPTEQRNINMVFQDFALWPHMKARDNILYGLKVKKIEKNERENRLERVVSLLHLDGLLNQYPSELSGGQQQRVAIARALITQPSIVLLDEPLCNLDIQLRIEMRTEMAQLFHALKTTVFHVTHDPSEAFAMADRIVVMNDGVIDQTDTPFVCYQRPRTGMVAGLLGAGNQLNLAIVLSGSGENCKVALGDAALQGKFFGGEMPERETWVKLKFRPEDCGWTDLRGQDTFPAQIILSTFEGDVYRIKARTAAGEEFCLLHPEYLEEGRRGYVHIPKEKLYVYV